MSGRPKTTCTLIADGPGDVFFLVAYGKPQPALNFFGALEVVEIF